jgi:hypothetical protein
VVVDASFHHFTNINLTGFIEQGQPNDDFKVFTQYYHNILSYLLPPNKQIAHFVHLLTALRFSAPLLEEIQGLSPDNWSDIIYAGHITRKVISNNFSPAHARSCALTMISSVQNNLRTPLHNILNLWHPSEHSKDNLFFLNSEAVLIAVLGSVMLGLASPLPETYHLVSHAVADLRELATNGLNQGLVNLQLRIGNLAQHLEGICNIS